MLYILDITEKVVANLTNSSPGGLGYWDDKHIENIVDHRSEYEFETSAQHPYAEQLIEENFVAREDLDGNTILFKIKELDEYQQDGVYLKRVICENAAVAELNTNFIRPVTFKGIPAPAALDHALAQSRWERGQCDFLGSQTITFENYPTMLAGLHHVAKVFDGEIQYRVEIVNNRIVKRYVDLLQRRGEVTGKRFEYAKDIVGLHRKSNSYDLATALIPLGPPDDKGKLMTIHSVNNNKDWIGDDEARDRWSKDGQHIFAKYEDQDAQNPADLKSRALAELERVKNPLYNYEIDVLLLESLAGHAADAVRIGDTINIVDTSFSDPLLLSARIIELERSYTDPTQDKAILGEYERLFADTPSTVRRLQQQMLYTETKVGAQQKANQAAGTGVHMIANGPKPLENGDYENIGKQSMYIEATENIHMGYVSVFCETDEQSGKVELIRRSDGVVLESREFENLIAGENKLNLDFKVDKDTEYEVTGEFSGKTWRTTGEIEYPYSSGSFKVTGTSSPGNWCFFYYIHVGGSGVAGAYSTDFNLGDTMSIVNTDGDTVLSFDGTVVGAETLVVEKVVSPSITSLNSKDLTLSINPTSGEDDARLDEVSSGLKKFKSIQQALDALPNTNNGDITLDLEENAMENVKISGYNGSGSIVLDLNGNTLEGSIRAYGCNNSIIIRNGRINNKDESYSTIYAVRCADTSISQVVIDGRNTARYCITITSSGHGNVRNCEVYRADVGIRATFGILAEFSDNKGYCTTAMSSVGASVVAGSGTQPNGTTLRSTSEGGTFTGTWIVDSGTAPPPTTPKTTKSYKAILCDSYRYSVYIGWRGENVAYQGQYGYGMHKGLWFFPAQMFTDLQGKSISSLKLRLTRLGQGGYGESDVVIRYHNYSTKPTGDPTMSNDYVTITKWDLGETKEITLPVSFRNAFSAGTAKGVGLYTPNTDKKYYNKFSAGATLIATY